MGPDTTTHSFWQRASGAYQPEPPLQGDLSVDVLIVGGGYTGLSTGWHLKRAQPGMSVALLEADVVGFGASGRNGGFVSESFGLPGVTERRFGKRRLIEGLQYVRQGVEYVREIITTHQLDSDYDTPGVVGVSFTDVAPTGDRGLPAPLRSGRIRRRGPRARPRVAAAGVRQPDVSGRDRGYRQRPDQPAQARPCLETPGTDRGGRDLRAHARRAHRGGRTCRRPDARRSRDRREMRPRHQCLHASGARRSRRAAQTDSQLVVPDRHRSADARAVGRDRVEAAAGTEHDADDAALRQHHARGPAGVRRRGHRLRVRPGHEPRSEPNGLGQDVLPT